MSDAIKAAYAKYDSAASDLRAAALALSTAITAYRAEHPAPKGQYWALRGDEMALRPLPDTCTVEDDGVECGRPAVSWDTDGTALCRQHLEER